MPVYIDFRDLGIDGETPGATTSSDHDYKYVSIRRLGAAQEGGDETSPGLAADEGGGTRAGYDQLLRLDGITGETADADTRSAPAGADVVSGEWLAPDAAATAATGGAAGRPSGPTILVRNHELNAQAVDDGAILRDDAAAASVDLPDVLVTSYQLSGHGGGSESSTGELSHADALMGATPESGMAEGPPGTGKTLSAAVLGQRAQDGAVLVDGPDPAAGISHATTVLAWARVDGVSPATREATSGTIHVESFSWGVSQHGNHSRPAEDVDGRDFLTWQRGGVPAADGGGVGGGDLGTWQDNFGVGARAGTGDDVVVDGGIITGEDPAATQHELGHTLGFRHEHVGPAPDAGTPGDILAGLGDGSIRFAGDGVDLF